MPTGLVTALRTLTCLPVPGQDARDVSSSLSWFPVVGALLGLLLYGLSVLAELCPEAVWSQGVALVLVGTSTFLTRGLHLDGLADWADGFASMTSKDNTLKIMKDPRLGTFGVLALAGVLFSKWVAFTRLIESGSAVWLISAYVVSRTVQTELAVSLPYARAEGGTGAPFVTDGRTGHRVGAWLFAFAILAFLGPYGPATLVPGFVAAKVLGYWFRRRLDGITGDLIGAASEIVETLILLLCALLGAWLVTVTGWSFLP